MDDDQYQYSASANFDDSWMRSSRPQGSSYTFRSPFALPEDTDLARRERQTTAMPRKEVDDTYAASRQRYGEQFNPDVARYQRRLVLNQRQRAEDYAVLKQNYEELATKFNNLQAQHLSLKTTLDQRTSELQGVQKFLTTADKFSGSEVVNTLRKLNEGVQQTTTYMSEWAVEQFTFKISPTAQQTTPRTTKQTRASAVLGKTFMELLGTKKHEDNPILVELALRAYLIHELHRIASLWDIGQEERLHNGYIESIYHRMRGTEDQSVSANWRALTRAYTLPAYDKDSRLEQTTITIIDTIIVGLSTILSAAGCTTAKSEIGSTILSTFAEQIHHFVTLAGQMNKMIGVGVVSHDFKVLAVLPETVYDEKMMEDSYDNEEGVQGTDERKEIVLCATELGLMMVGAGGEQKGEASDSMVIKPKVALLSEVLDIVDG